MNTLKRHLSVANVLSVVAIFIALSASAVAATKLGPGQVKEVNIANEAVSNPKLKNLGITSSKIANGTIVTGKLKGSSVIAGKLGKEAVTAGKIKKKAVGTAALAPESVTGAKIGSEAITAAKVSTSFYSTLVKGTVYPAGVETATNEVEEKTAIAACPTGKQAIAGGARVNGTLKEVAITGSQPYFNGTAHSGWEAFARDIVPGGGAGPWSLTVFAVCAEL
ncbi:MAG TPA: hypothetical protein VFB52_01455 [Solirubrobacterales bacterium]|nr:hypothetical protein [Solirubrobacterales bacterium]